MVLKLSKRGNNFLYRNFLRFEMDLELKFKKKLYELKTRKNSLDKHGTLEFDEIW
jgi:hypothetical protein